MGEITPDLREWLVADGYVCSHWPQFASSLHLSSSIPSLSVTRPDSWTDTHKLSQLLYLWRRDQPGTYNVRTLLRVLRLLGLRDMEQWIQLMVGRRYCGPEEIVENHHGKTIKRESFNTKDEKEQNSKFTLNDITMSPSSDYNGSGDSHCVSPTSDRESVPVYNNYSSDSGLSSSYSDVGEQLFRSCLTVDISTGRVTRVHTVTDEVDDDLLERSFHSVLHSAEELCLALPEEGYKDRTNFSFVSNKREKSASSRVQSQIFRTKLGGIFRTLFRPEGKLLSRLFETIQEKSMSGKNEDKNVMKIKPEDHKHWRHKCKQKKCDAKPEKVRNTFVEIESEKYFTNLVTSLQRAVQSLDCSD